MLRHCRNLTRRGAGHRLGNGADMFGCGAATTAKQIDQAGLGPFAQESRGLLGRFVIFAKLIGQTSIWVGRDPRIGNAR